MSPVTAFLTDSTICIGCKACEVACKEWNGIKADGLEFSGFSYDNTGAVGHSTWRHVKFVEQGPVIGLGGNALEFPAWGFSSDVCKHCEVAGCLEACPTGSIVRTEFGGVYIQPDVCNGCAYCVVACPFGVVERNQSDGRAFKCTFCYDRQKVGLTPACATACPTESIKFGEISELRETAQARVEALHERGVEDARIYDPRDSSVGGTHSIFILRGDPRTYNLPPQPRVPGEYMSAGWTSAAIAAGAMLAGALIAFLGDSRR
ncbi:MAG: 4Fe-4S dicluster domain-containing protein [Candidatus Koribacter versatilis]|uniref:4Fe-4S dicluster domain-containing protein n=1 Tax=Candidatus Korobacter versatilis TaxID=658062 RepID=A0A932ENB9_9BACT|nr:4Fe-4S dicluster domain-containing protein [Candidatus Koribacter versatilis]